MIPRYALITCLIFGALNLSFGIDNGIEIPLSGDNQSWLNPVWMEEVPQSGSNYVSAALASQPRPTIRTSPAGSTADGDADFPGESLRIISGTKFLIKQESNQSLQINGGKGELVLDGGTLHFGPNNNINTVVFEMARMEVRSSSIIELALKGRDLILNGVLSGDGNLMLRELSNGDAQSPPSVTFGQVSDYTGALVVSKGMVVSCLENSTFSGVVTLQDRSKFSVRAGQTITFDGGVRVGRSFLPPGSYSGKELSGLSGSFINNGGTIEVAAVSLVKIRVYLLGGQSNMQGVGRTSKLTIPQLDQSKTLLYHSSGVSSSGGSKKLISLRPAGASKEYFGPEIGIGEVFSELYPGQPVALIKHARGGSNLDVHWSPGTNNQDRAHWGRDYTKFVATVKDGLADLKAAGYDPKIYGMFWQQGEEDAKNGRPESQPTGFNGSGDDYGVHLKDFIGRIREQFSDDASTNGIRFVLGQVFPHAPDGGGVQRTYPAWSVVRQFQLDVDESSDSPLSVKNTSTVPTLWDVYPSHATKKDEFRDGDETHICAEAQLKLGRAMAHQMNGLSAEDARLKLGQFGDFPANPVEKPGWSLVRADEFNEPELDESLWIPEYFPGRFKDTKKAVYYFEDGAIHIVSDPDAPRCSSYQAISSIQTYNCQDLHHKYESTSVESDDRFSQLYGWYEIRAKHVGPMHHIAFWMLEAKKDGDEIDVTEDPKWTGPNWHAWKGQKGTTFPTYRTAVSSYDNITSKKLRASEFHIYALEVFPGGTRIYHDNQLIETAKVDWKKKGEIPLMFFLGIYGSQNREERSIQQEYVVDYFRAYQKAEL